MNEVQGPGGEQDVLQLLMLQDLFNNVQRENWGLVSCVKYSTCILVVALLIR